MAKKNFDLDKFLAENKGLLKEKKQFDWKILLYVGMGVVAVILVYLLMVMPSDEAPAGQEEVETEINDMIGPEAEEDIEFTEYEECMTKQCFIDAANAGTPALFENKISTISLLHTVESPGEYTKTVTDVDVTEPQEIQDLFLGAMMTCYYDEGNFDADYVDMISGNIIPCEGTLVDSILAVIV